ncbi:MAG: catalase, partial [Pseudonocardiales bacterium]|nr:catalase [Pseudonocardiales bacterium]
RARLGVNYRQIPVNTPRVPVHSYSKDGAMRVQNVADPVYAPNSYGGPKADPQLTDDGGHWYADGDMVRAAYTLHPEDDDWGQPGKLVREVLDDAARERLVNNVVGHLLNGVSEPVLNRAFDYWRNVDKDLGDRIEAGVHAKQGEKDPKAAQQGNPARSSMQAKA